MRSLRILALLAVFAGLTLPVAAQLSGPILEVRHSSNVYAEPDKKSDVVHQISVKSGGIVVIALVDDEKQNGYYQVRLPGQFDQVGWIYKTYVRRLTGADKHPKYEPYERRLYRHWIDENKDCRFTRDDVLVRDSNAKVTFLDERECKVAKGSWIDPYTGVKIVNPLELDVDHVVPLKNAHVSGAWTWDAERRKQYANYMEYRAHLLPVDLSENRRKSDKGPEKYMPPNESYRCEYVQHWVKIKQDWGLEMNDQERAVVARVRQECRAQAKVVAKP